MTTTWDLTILDADVPADSLDGFTAGDIDNDGNVEIITGGNGALLWYRPATRERGVIAEMRCHVGIAIEDLDGDGKLEVVICDSDPAKHLYWFKAGKTLSDPWQRFTIDDDLVGAAHDIVFGDIDGDGRRELVVDAVYSNSTGIFVYKPGADVRTIWRKHTVATGRALEGTAIADLDGDSRPEIISGPDWFKAPPAGPFSGPWQRHTFAPSHREMCRVAVVDITGNGRPDLVLVDSEYLDGRLSWFENRLGQTPAWIEHEIEADLVYAHSLTATRESGGSVRLFVAEMPKGGWDAPINRQARLIDFVSTDGGKTWTRDVLYHGEGTHEARPIDLDGDGNLEIVGKDPYEKPYDKNRNPRVQIWKRGDLNDPIRQYRHRFLDRDKPHTAIDIFAADVDGDGKNEIACGRWWYRLDTGDRFDIPGIAQAIAAYDIDGDGRQELIGITPKQGESYFYNQLCSDLVWLKPIDPVNGLWEQHVIGTGSGDWPHGNAIAPLLPGGRLAMVIGYHDALDRGVRPEIFDVPTDPTRPWPKRQLADIAYGEEFVVCDVDNDGRLDLIAGAWWLQNRGDGTFTPYRFAEGLDAARVAVGDFTGNGRVDVLIGQELLDFTKRIAPRAPLVWYENPKDPTQVPWPRHVIDKIRCPHSIGVADLDGDGVPEIIAGEHDPFYPYRSRCDLYVYKRADPAGKTWTRYRLDNRFEHHDGAKPIDLGNGRIGIVSHGWQDSIYVHLWEI